MSSHAFQTLSTLEKKSIFLVLIGTFLEYFDMMLYVHLAVTLNPLFFPSSDPLIAGLLGVFAFSSAYLLRPIGAFVFGYVGDRIGRKASIVWTSGIMACAALTIAFLPTYASLGFTAAVLFLLARGLQGFSTVGEFISAQVYVVELSGKSSHAHFLSVLPMVSCIAGSTVALGIGMLSVSLDPVSGWRWPFFFGGVIALVGGVIRSKALESSVFQEVQNKKKDPSAQDVEVFLSLLALRTRNYWCYFGIEMLGAFTGYFALRYCSDFLKKTLGLSTVDVMCHNFWMLVTVLPTLFFYGWLSRFYDPMLILKRRLLIGLCLLPLLFWGWTIWPTQSYIFCVQFLTCGLLSWSSTPAQSRVMSAFPVIGRCTNLGSAFAISHALVYALTALLVFLSDYIFGIWGVGSLFIGIATISFFSACAFTPNDGNKMVGSRKDTCLKELEARQA